MKSITFNQGLMAVGVIGLTLALSEGWQVVAAIRPAFAEGGGGVWLPFTVILQGVALVVPLGAIYTAWARWGDEAPAPLTNRQFLELAALFGLMLVSMGAPLTPLLMHGQGLDPWTAAVFVAQALAVAVPLAVLLRDIEGRAKAIPDGSGDPLTLSGLVRAFVLLGLTFAAAAAPGAVASIAILGRQDFLLWALLADPVATLVVGGLMAAALAAMASRRVRASVGIPGSAALLGMTALLALGAATVAGNSWVAGLTGISLLLVAILAVLGLFLANAVTADPDTPPPHQGRVLVAIGLAGMMLAAASLLEVVESALPLWGAASLWRGDAGVPGFVMTGVAVAVNLGVLVLGVRALREGGGAAGHAVPRALATSVALVSAADARRGVGLLGSTVVLGTGLALVGLIWLVVEEPGPAPSVPAPIALLVGALAVALALTSRGAGAFGDRFGGDFEPDAGTGLTYSGLLAATGLFGLVTVALVASFTALGISALVWEGPASPASTIVVQAAVFLVPLAVVGVGGLRARQAARSGELDDRIDLPRLAMCLALLGAAVAASGSPLVFETLWTADSALSGLASDSGVLIQFAAGCAVLLVSLVLLLGGAARVSALLSPAPAPVVAGLLGLGTVVVVASFGGSVMLPIGLVALAVVALYLFKSGQDPAPGTAATADLWRRATVPLLGLAFLMPLTPGIAGLLAMDPTDGFSLFTIFVLAFAYAINVWPLARVIDELRRDG